MKHISDKEIIEIENKLRKLKGIKPSKILLKRILNMIQQKSKYSTGAVVQPWYTKDIRQYRLEVAAGAVSLPETYETPYQGHKEQGASLSCVAQGVSAYTEVLNFKEEGKWVGLSARDLYSRIFLPQGGAFVLTALKEIKNRGIVPEELAPSYEGGNPPSEVFMRTRADITKEEEEAGMTYICQKYVDWNSRNFEMYKQAIYQGLACVFIVYGADKFWDQPIIETPGSKDECPWTHLVMATGWVKINGVEYIKIRNWWGKTWGDSEYGYISKDMIEKGFCTNVYTLIDLPNGTYNQMVSLIFKLKELIAVITEFLKNKSAGIFRNAN